MPITVTQLADLTAMNPGFLNKLLTQGVIPRSIDNKLTLGATVQSLLAHYRRARAPTMSTKVQEARAAEINLRIAEREGRLIDVDETEEMFAQMFGAFRARLSSIPSRVTRDQDMRRKIELEIDDALASLSDEMGKESERLKAGARLPPTAAAVTRIK